MHVNRRGFLETGAVLAAGSMLGRHALAQSAGPAARKGDLDAAVRSAVERKAVPGVVAGLTSREGNLYEGAFGERGLGQGLAMTFDTVTYMASMTKAITATAAMQLVEQGKLDLDSPISRWVPGAATKFQVLEGWDKRGEPRLRPAQRQITLRHLLTHTSGLVYNVWDADLDRYMKARNVPALDSGDEAAFYPPLMFEPGTRWEYGISIDWAGKLVETVSGKSLGTYMRENIFEPLGMGSTAYKLSPDMEARRARTHQRDPKGALDVTEWVSRQNPAAELGGGGLYSTAPDYLQFVRMILNEGRGNGHQILKPETVAQMSRNAMGDTRVTMLKSQNLARSLDAEFFPGLPKSWGLSFMINEEQAPTGRPAGSLAWAGIQNTFFWIDPKNGIAGVYLAQVLPFVDEPTLAAFYAFEKAVYQSMA